MFSYNQKSSHTIHISFEQMKKQIKQSSLAVLLCWFSIASQGVGQHPEAFPFTFPHDVKQDSTSVTNFAYLNQAPAGTEGFVAIADGHFVNDKGRTRFWGVNFCFGANFPTHDESERIARRLAALGINCVRIHHHETSYSPRGLFFEDGKMDPAQVDKLDFLLAELHKQGIYANLNMHVGRSVAKSLGLPPLGRGHSATGDKHAMHFMPKIQEAFWQYCRDYIGHTNPYRNLTRGNDPGIAMIELLNENRFSRDGVKYLRDAPDVYKNEILRQWNSWLKKKYSTNEALITAWKPGDISRSKPMADSNLWKSIDGGSLGNGWIVQDNGGKDPVETSLKNGVLRIKPLKAAEQGWHQQVACENLSFTQGERYTLQFDIRADAEKSISFNSATIEGGWKQLGLGGSVVANTQWKSVTEIFEANKSVDGTGRIAFDTGGTDVAFEMRNITLKSGAGWRSLPAGQSLSAGNISIPDSGWVPVAYDTFIEFMTDTERAFYQKTTELLRNELGVKVPICGTQTNYVGAKLASKIGDYTDMHSYWNHPLFQGREWDQEKWTVGNETLVADPYSNQWPRNNPLMRAAWRVHGMPFTYSEWNIGEPSFTSAGAIPIMGMLGSVQDWDGVFFFDYEDQGGQWDDDRIHSFFRINGQPCKLAILGAFGKMYRRGELDSLKEIHRSAEGDHYGDGVHALSKLVGLDPNLDRVTGTSPPDADELTAKQPPRFVTPDNSVVWDARDPDKASVMINTDETKSVWGLVGNQSFDVGDWKVSFGEIPKNYGVLIATSHDAQPLSKTASGLIVAVNHAENNEMKWNTDHTSVGKGWGTGPAKVWGVRATIKLPTNAQKRLNVFAVEANGKRLETVPVRVTEGHVEFELDPKYKTLMYEIGWIE
jgi:hypothetical protein